jgi:aerobic carbon-monoxide dehydrogenase large subunit
MIPIPPGAPARDGHDEIERLATGNGRFVADLVPSNALHCWFVRSPIAHGLIRKIDATEARNAPGVVAVYTAPDLALPDLSFTIGAGPDAGGMERPVLARDRVRFVGEATALVVADSRPRAEDAGGLVWVDIDPIPAVVTAAAAKTDGEQLFPDRGSNVLAVTESAAGPEPDRDDLIEVTVEVDHPRLAPSPLETLQILAVPDDGRLLVWCGHQSPHQLRAQLAGFLGLAEEAIRVTVPDVGGAFGMKRLYPEYVAVAKAALMLGRPLAWNATRTEVFLAGTHGRAQHHHVTLSADPEGRIHRARFELDTNTGAYPHSGSLIGGITRLVAGGLYAIPRIEFRNTIVVTNTAPTAPYRGAGRPEAALAIERSVDALARTLDLDPAEVRRINFVDRWPYQSPTGAVYDSGDYEGALDRALDLVDYPAVRAEQRRRLDNDEDPIGIGIGAYLERAGGAADSGEYGAIAIDGDGGVTVRTGSTSTGQGHEEAWRGLVASILTVDPGVITIISGDTDAVPRGVGTFASRSTQIGASAVWRVATRARDRARDLAAEMIEASALDVVLADGAFTVAGVPGRGVTLAEVAARADAGGAPISFEEFYVPGAQTFPYGVHVAVVEVSRETGAVSLERLVAVEDVGNVLDERLVEAQLHGSLLQGVGAAMLEEMHYDEYGQPLTASFSAYIVPGSGNRLNLTAARIEHAAPSNPLGAKGAGEGGTIGAPPAILNATIDALAPYGVTDLQLPLLPDRVWEALQRARRPTVTQ